MVHSIEHKLDQEQETAINEIHNQGIAQAVLTFYKHHSQITADVLSKSNNKIDCHAGCTYCCYYKVEARAYEIIAIADFVKQYLSAQQQEMILTQAKRNIEEVKDLSYKEHVATNQQCAFLIDNQCSVYQVRPIKCRDYHSTHASYCKDSYDHPHKTDIPNGYCPELKLKNYSATAGFITAAQITGYDKQVYDLSSAFLEAYSDPTVKERLNKKQRVFVKAKTNNQ